MTSTVSDRHPIDPRTSFRRGLSYIVGLIGIGVTYFLLAKSGLALALIHPSASLIWPPTGFALAAIVLWGYRVWPAIFFGALLANATAAGSIGTAMSIATGNSLEALVGAALINVWSNGRDTFSTSNAVAKFAVICALVATPISASVGSTTLALAGYAESTTFANIWLTWWMGDLISALVVTPVVVLCALGDARTFRRPALIESAAVISFAVVIGFIAFNPSFKQSQHPDALGFLAVLPLLWAALRRGPRDTALASLILAGFSIWGTFSSAAPSTAASLNNSLLSVLVFLISVSVPTLALSADVAMRKTIEEALRRAHTELDGRVEIRTAELATANQALRDEVSRRAGTEREALEQQTATSEVLQVIASSPGELQPVFEAMLENAVRICEAKVGILFLHENGIFNPMAMLGLVPAFNEFLIKRGPFRPGPNTTNGYLLRTKQVSHWDVGDIDSTLVKLSGARTTLGVPMLKDDVLIGSIVIFRQEVRPFTDKQIALVQNFAGQAVIAIENTRLLSELRARTSELTRSVGELRALGDVSQAVNSTLDLQTVLNTIVATATQISGTEVGAIYVFDEGTKEFQLSATFGMSAEMIAAVHDMHAEVSAVLESLTKTREASQIPDLNEQAPTPLNAIILRAGYRARLLVPLLRSDRVVGALVVRRRAPGEFASSTIDLLKTFAAQSVLAIQNARLFAEIESKSQQLELANTAKSRFLAMASHDLRQPLHALGLFAAQLRTALKPSERANAVERVNAAVKEMNEMFNSLLDISKLDAGIVTPKITEFPIARLLQKIETMFDQATREKGFRLRVIPNDAWVRSDAMLLERILLNLVSNAARYTVRGGIIVGCRQRGEMLRIEVWDSGPGIPEDQKRNIFAEFFQLPAPERDRYGGLGLGLAIVNRLCLLLDHHIELTSIVGRGSRFTILVPTADESVTLTEPVDSPHPAAYAVEGKVILVIDDAPIVQQATSGLLSHWGYAVVAAESHEAALTQLAARQQRPDLIISDYRVADGQTGIEAIERINAAFGTSIPAILISGDTAPERLHDAKDKGYILLHKPVDPMRLRAVMHQLFKDHDDGNTARALK